MTRRLSRAATWLLVGLALAAALVTGCKTDDQAAAVQTLPTNSAPKSTTNEDLALAHPWHRQRVENIRSEKIDQTIENLANFDDNHFAGTSSTGDLQGEMNRIVKLSRVRRLLIT